MRKQYLVVVQAEGGPVKGIRVVADSQKAAQKLVHRRLPLCEGLSHVLPELNDVPPEDVLLHLPYRPVTLQGSEVAWVLAHLPLEARCDFLALLRAHAAGDAEGHLSEVVFDLEQLALKP